MNPPKNSLGHLVWGQSLLSSRKASARTATSRGRAAAAAASLRPKLSLPKPLPPVSFQPARYFLKGTESKDPAPIRYLLTESIEKSVARPVPQKASLIRSLCKGSGVLRQMADGLIYLDIKNYFISAMMPYLKRQGLIKPPYFNLFGPSVGAHIPVVLKRELDFHYLSSIPELGKEFSFEIEGLYSLKPDGWPEVKEVWFFQIHSSELEAVRKRNFLIERPLGHPFHIAVAIQPREGVSIDEIPAPLMRINPAFLAA